MSFRCCVNRLIGIRYDTTRYTGIMTVRPEAVEQQDIIIKLKKRQRLEQDETIGSCESVEHRHRRGREGPGAPQGYRIQSKFTQFVYLISCCCQRRRSGCNWLNNFKALTESKDQKTLKIATIACLSLIGLAL